MIDRSTGNLIPVPGSPFSAGNGPTAIGSDPQGRLVFVGGDGSVPGARGSNCTLSASTILSEVVDRFSGTLSQTGSKTLHGVCVRSIAVDPASKHLYVGMLKPDGSTGGEIQGFLIGPSGTLTELPGSPFLLTGFPTGLAIHPNGRFVYAASDSGLLVIDRDATTGVLVERGAFNSQKQKLALNTEGTFLAASELTTNEVSEFHVDPATGGITATEERVQASSPAGIAADPLGTFFAATEVTDTNTLAGGVTTLRIDAATHILVKTSGSPFASGRLPVDVVFEPGGKYAYAVNRSDGNVAGFTLDRASGSLTLVPGAHFASGDFPNALTVVKPR